jgi:hypothetical protein
MKMRIFFLLFLLLPVMTLPSLELSEGKIKLIIHEQTGRFSLYYLSDVNKNTYTPLFLSEDPRTTFLTILEGNKTYRMGEAAGFTQSIEKTASGAKLRWKSSGLTVEEHFTFISSRSSALANGVAIKIRLENSSENTLDLGARYVFDTYLGEKDKTHFMTNTQKTITRETSFGVQNMPLYIVSTSEERDPGFQLMTKGEGITTPDRIILANWKRLNETSWTYEVNSLRNFNQLPYSINDSAIALYYQPERVSAGSTREIMLTVGNYDPEGYIPSEQKKKEDISAVFEKVLDQEEEADVETALNNDLLTVNDLVEKINRMIQSGEEITEDELEVMNQVIEELKKRKSRYENE